MSVAYPNKRDADMKNVYNHTSRPIKGNRLCIVSMCESRSCPCLDAETRHCGDPDVIPQPKKAGDCRPAR